MKPEPQPTRDEISTVDKEKPMLSGIQIVLKRRGDTMSRRSRVDFSRMYKVEHNIKVFDFGNVHPSHLGRLQSQWVRTITETGRSVISGVR
jgi:hypothetical protein